MLKRLVFPIIFIFSVLFAEAVIETVTVNPLIKAKDPTVGGHLFYSFELKNIPFQPSLNISFADPSKNEEIMIVTQNVEQTGDNNYKYYAEIVPFKVGVINFPSFNIFNTYVEPAAVTISSVIEKGTTVNLQESYLPYQDYSDLILLFVLILSVVIIYYAVKEHRLKKAAAAQIITPEQAHQLWQELRQIFQEDVAPEAIKKYYFYSSEQLRSFITKFLKFDVMELTSSEIRIYFKNKELHNEGLLFEVLESADLVKFAKYLPVQEEIAEYQRKALAFIDEYEPQQEQTDDL